MCGRYYETANEEVIKEEFDIKRESKELPKVQARYNIAPQQLAPVIRIDDNGDRELVFMRWGLIPSWSKDDKIAYNTINARNDTVAEKPSYRAAFKKRRCLIPASGFFEWKREDGKKVRNPQPYKFEIKGMKVFAFAGLWEEWTDPKGEIKETFTIVTTEPNPIVKDLHDRMPVILPKEHWDTWLDHSIQDKNLLLSLLKPLSDERMYSAPVSKDVNTIKNDTPELIKPITLEEQSETLF